MAAGAMKLVHLNADCLLHIFNYLDECDLLNLRTAHYLFRRLIDENIFARQTVDLLICGHRNAPRIELRTQMPFGYVDRLRIGRNWLLGRYREYEYFHHTQMFATKLHLERDWLYLTHGCYVRQYGRMRQEPLHHRHKTELACSVKTDVAHIVRKGGSMFVGHVCGMCYIDENDYITEQRLHTPKEYLHCLDFAGELYASSSDKCGRLWRRTEEFGLIHLDEVQQLKHAYKVLQFNDAGDRLFGGLYTDVGRHALRAVDVETGFETALNSNTISIYDLKLKDDNIVFTANFDTTFRMHDYRMQCDVAIWEDPFDSSFYCLDYDGLYAVLCGTKYHSRVNLYDIRVPGKYVQLYFPQNRRQRRRSNSSPVYSLACDSRYLFVATDHNLRIFDFKADCATSRDYRNIFCETLRY